MVEVYFVVFALEYWALMVEVAAADAAEDAAADVAATPAVIAVWMALENP